jgi:hypothetical protein
MAAFRRMAYFDWEFPRIQRELKWGSHDSPFWLQQLLTSYGSGLLTGGMCLVGEGQSDLFVRIARTN